jgi:hypothetical protein
MNNVIAYWAVWGPPLPFVALSAIGLWLSVSRRTLEFNGSLWAIVGFAAALLASLSELRVAFARIEVSLAYARGESLLESAGVESFAIWNLLAYVLSLVALTTLLAAVFAGRRKRGVA